jgi:hypothetical protein
LWPMAEIVGTTPLAPCGVSAQTSSWEGKATT